VADEVKAVDSLHGEPGHHITGQVMKGRASFNRGAWLHGMGAEPPGLEPALQVGKVPRWTAEGREEDDVTGHHAFVANQSGQGRWAHFGSGWAAAVPRMGWLRGCHDEGCRETAAPLEGADRGTRVPSG